MMCGMRVAHGSMGKGCANTLDQSPCGMNCVKQVLGAECVEAT